MTNEFTFISSLGSQNYLPVNRTLMAALGINQAIYLAELCNYYMYFAGKGMLDEDGLFYTTHEYIQRRTTLTSRQQRFCEALLREKNIITVVRKGMPARNWYKINTEVLMSILTSTNIDFSVEIDENEDLQFDKIVNQDVTKCNNKIDKIVKHDVTKCYDKMLQNVTTDTIYNKKKSDIKKTDSLGAGFPNGNPSQDESEQNLSSVCQTGEDSFEDVLSPSTRKGKQSRKQFTPPSLEEVKAYCESKKLPVDAEFFYDYYNESNWVDSKGNPVLNWKLKAVTWAQKNKEKVAPAPKTSADKPTELPKNYLSACDKLGLFEWKNLTEYSDTIWELARWSKDCRCNDAFMQDNPDVYGVFAYPEEFWKSYLAFVCDMIGGTKPREGHFRLKGKTFMCWYDEMEIKGGI